MTVRLTTAAVVRHGCSEGGRVLARLVARALARRLKLIPATTGYRITAGVTVPMRDGVSLLGDLYEPTDHPATTTMLMRGPYAREGLPARVMAGLYAARGYRVVVLNSRGTFGSGGEFDPGRSEVADGADAVDWLRRQQWFGGTFVTVGGSYLGFTQWALLVDPPPELHACVISMGPHDLSRAVWGTGSFALDDFLSWAYQIAWQDSGGWIRQLVRSTTSPRRLRPILAELPPAGAARTVLGGGSNWYESWLRRADPGDDYWSPLRLDAAFDEVRQPVLLTGGWQDVFVDQTLEQYRELRARGADVSMVIGPWTHGQGGGAQIRETLAWLGGRRHPTPVRICVTGDGGWRDLPDWPPVSSDRVLYPGEASTLADGPPATGTPPVRFTYDPADPTPTIGGRLLGVSAAGYRVDGALAQRADVIAFTGPVLPADLDVIGHPSVELEHVTDIPWADVAVRISDVDEKGVSRNVADGYVRLGEGRAGSLWIELDPVAHRFRAGHRIRLLVAGGSFPRFARNLGTGEPLATGTRLARSTHTVTPGTATRLVLPVVPAPQG